MNAAVLLRNCENVKIEEDDHNNHILILNDGQFTNKINKRSQIGRIISTTNVENAVDMLHGGHFFFLDGKLSEFRNNEYDGFIQSDDIIQRFANTPLNEVMKSNFHITDFGEGGKFNLKTGFTWSAFASYLKTEVSMMRLICENGAVVKHKMFEKKVHIMNNYDDHLKIAAEQINKMATKEVTNKVYGLQKQTASVQDVIQLENHIAERMTNTTGHESQLQKYLDVIDQGKFDQKYTPAALRNASISHHLASHMTKFDLFNMATELNTHTKSSDRSSNNALNMLITRLLFSEDHVGKTTKIGFEKTFDNPELAFFG